MLIGCAYELAGPTSFSSRGISSSPAERSRSYCTCAGQISPS
jgi:hypothetical protein